MTFRAEGERFSTDLFVLACACHAVINSNSISSVGVTQFGRGVTQFICRCDTIQIKCVKGFFIYDA